MRIVSLVPSASEIICDLGLKKSLVAVSHECNYPASLNELPIITSSSIDNSVPQIQINNLVRTKVAENKSLYEINGQLLNDLEPDTIITQGVCDVCAVSDNQVEATLKGQLCTLSAETEIISLNGRSFNGICKDIETLGKKHNKEKEASLIIDNANAEKEIMLSEEKSDIRVLCLEWIDPYFSAGHWVPEQIEMAGFVSAIGNPGDQSRVLTVDEIMESKPDVIAVICCGYSDKENEVFAHELLNDKNLSNLNPIKQNKVFYFDSDSYFSRPTLRIIEGAKQLREKILTHI